MLLYYIYIYIFCFCSTFCSTFSEFDKFMEEHKGVLTKSSDDGTEIDEDIEVEIDRADQQVL